MNEIKTSCYISDPGSTTSSTLNFGNASLSIIMRVQATKNNFLTTLDAGGANFLYFTIQSNGFTFGLDGTNQCHMGPNTWDTSKTYLITVLVDRTDVNAKLTVIVSDRSTNSVLVKTCTKNLNRPIHASILKVGTGDACQDLNGDITAVGFWNRLLSQTEINHIKESYMASASSQDFDATVFSYPKIQLAPVTPYRITGMLWYGYGEYPLYPQITRATPIRTPLTTSNGLLYDYTDMEVVFANLIQNLASLEVDLSSFDDDGCSGGGFTVSFDQTVLVEVQSSFITAFRIYKNDSSFSADVTLCSSAACVEPIAASFVNETDCVIEYVLPSLLNYRVTHLSFQMSTSDEIMAVAVDSIKLSNKLGMWPLQYQPNPLVDLTQNENHLSLLGPNSSSSGPSLHGAEYWFNSPLDAIMRTSSKIVLPADKLWEVTLCVDFSVNSGDGNIIAFGSYFSVGINDVSPVSEGTVCLVREELSIKILVDGIEVNQTDTTPDYLVSSFVVVGDRDNDIDVRNLVFYNFPITESQAVAHIASTAQFNSTYLSNFESMRYSYAPRVDTQISTSLIHSGEPTSWYASHGEMHWCVENFTSSLQSCNAQSVNDHSTCGFQEYSGVAYGSFSLYGNGTITLAIDSTASPKHEVLVSFNGAYVLRYPKTDFREQVTLLPDRWNIIRIASSLDTSMGSSCGGYAVNIESATNMDVQWSFINPTRHDIETEQTPIIVESYNCGDNVTIDVQGVTGLVGDAGARQFSSKSGFEATFTYHEPCDNAVISIRTDVGNPSEQETIEATFAVEGASTATAVGVGGTVFVEDRVRLHIEVHTIFNTPDVTYNGNATVSLQSTPLSDDWSLISSEHARLAPHPSSLPFVNGILSLDIYFPIHDVSLLPAFASLVFTIPNATNSPFALNYTILQHTCSANYCNGHGTCDELYGCLCSQDTATNGHWDRESRCSDCLDGYYGFSCGPQCPGAIQNSTNDLIVCFGHGTCDDGIAGSGTCSCEGNWSPDSGCSDCTSNYFGMSCSYECSVCGAVSNICDSGVLGSGSCICKNEGQEGANCASCKMGYASSVPSSGLCDIVCPNLCNYRGECKSDGTCDCFEGYGGISCQSQCKLYQNMLCGGPTRGTCDEQCNCEPNFFGDDCSECAPGKYGANCENNCTTQVIAPYRNEVYCSGHGKCVGNGTCECDTFYSGDLCQYSCPALAGDLTVCSGHGVCVDGKCECSNNFNGPRCQYCDDGFVGPSCSATCPTNCDSRGTCVWDETAGDAICYCSQSYCSVGVDKKDCRQSRCNTCMEFERSILGTCTPCDCAASRAGVCNPQTGICKCNNGYFGKECLPCSVPCVHGTCVDGNTCKCEIGYWGVDCSNLCACSDVSFCNSTSGECQCGQSGEYQMAGVTCHESCAGVSPNGPCNGHGECELSGTCDCDQGWGGVECEIPCLHGRVENGSCVCENYWNGARCDKTLSCSGDNATQCSRHGICTDNGLCQCFSDEYNGFWTGMTCDTCSEGHRGLFCDYLNGPTTILSPIRTNSSSLFSPSVLHALYVNTETPGDYKVDVVAGGGSTLLTLGNPFQPSDPAKELDTATLTRPGVVCGILFVHIYQTTAYIVKTCNATTGDELKLRKCGWSSQGAGACTTDTSVSTLDFTGAVGYERNIFILVGTKNVLAFYDGTLVFQINDAVHNLELIRSIAVSQRNVILGGQRRLKGVSTWDISVLKYSPGTLILTSDSMMKSLIENFAPIDIGNVLCALGPGGNWTAGTPCDGHSKYNDVAQIKFNGDDEIVAAVTTNDGEIALLHVDIAAFKTWHILPVNDANVFPGNVLAMAIDVGYEQGFLSCYSTATRKSSLYRFRVTDSSFRLIGYNDVSKYGTLTSFIIQPTTRLLWASLPINYGQETLFYPLTVYAAMDSIPRVTHSASKIKVIGSGFRSDVKTYCWIGGKSTLGKVISSSEVACDVQTTAKCGLIEISISNGEDHERNVTQTSTVPITVLDYPTVTSVVPLVSPENVGTEIYLIGEDLKSSATSIQKCIFTHYRDYNGGAETGSVVFLERAKAFVVNTTHVVCHTTYPYPFSVGLSLDGNSLSDDQIDFYLPDLRLCSLTGDRIQTCVAESFPPLQSEDSEWTSLPNFTFVVTDVLKQSLKGISVVPFTAGIRIIESQNYPNDIPMLYGNDTIVSSVDGVVTFSELALLNASVDVLTLEAYDTNNNTILPATAIVKITPGNAYAVQNVWDCAFQEKTNVSLRDFANNTIRLDIKGFDTSLTSSLLMEDSPGEWVRPLYTGGLAASIQVMDGTNLVYSVGPGPGTEIVFDTTKKFHYLKISLGEEIIVPAGSVWLLKMQSQGSWREVTVQNASITTQDSAQNTKVIADMMDLSNDEVTVSISFEVNTIELSIYECTEESLPCITADDEQSLLCDLPMPENIRVGSMYKVQYNIKGLDNETSYSRTCAINDCSDKTKYSHKGVCYDCPVGGSCNGSGSDLVVSLPGYWRSAPLTFYKCRFAENCPGGNQCTAESTGPLCQYCIDDHAKHLGYGSCTECSSLDVVFSLLYFLLLLLIMTGFTVLVLVRSCEYQLVLLRLAIDYGQTSAFLLGIHPNLKFFVEDYFYSLRYFVLDFASTKSWRCFLGLDDSLRHFIVTMILCPVLTLLVALFSWGVFKVLKRSKKQSFQNGDTELDKQLLEINTTKLEKMRPRQSWTGCDFEDYVNANENWVTKVEEIADTGALNSKYEIGVRNALFTSWCVCYYLLFSSIIFTVVEKFSCVDITYSNTVTLSVLWSSPLESCPWSTASLIAALTVYAFVIPLALVAAMKIYHNMKGDVQTEFVFSGLIAGYKRSTWAWFISVLIRKAGIISISVSRIETLTRAYILMWVWTIPTVAHFLINPFENEIHNTVEGYVILAVFLSLNIGLLGADDGTQSVHYDYKSIPSIIVLTVNVLGWIIILWGLLRPYFKRDKEERKPENENLDLGEYFGDILDENVVQREVEALSQNDEAEMVSLPEEVPPTNRFDPDTAPGQCLVIHNNTEMRMSFAHGLQQVAIGPTTRLDAMDLRKVYKVEDPENQLIIETAHNKLTLIGNGADVEMWCSWLQSSIVGQEEEIAPAVEEPKVSPPPPPQPPSSASLYHFATPPPPTTHFLDDSDEEVTVLATASHLRIGSCSIPTSDIVSVTCGTDTIKIKSANKGMIELFGADSDVATWSDFFNASKKPTQLLTVLATNSGSGSEKFVPVDDL
eukprot:TRINITY_DN400_c1_g1_i1.p1 TRINITY_DN400_c1_g1~~TRINITY_DN400_c1_g1_i1.p1  ORF type:complete len:3444 (+),score=505.40 TRINITY_DN400_c1_g1_i1:687-10334(+)